MQYVKDFQHLKVFRGLSEIQIVNLNAVLKLHRFLDQEIIFNQGDPAWYLYILLDGEVSIRFKPYDGNALTIAKIIPGGVFGWSAALGREQYTSVAISSLESSVFSISKLNLHKICMLENETGIIFLENLTSVIAARLNQNHSQILKILTRASFAKLGEESKL